MFKPKFLRSMVLVAMSAAPALSFAEGIELNLGATFFDFSGRTFGDSGVKGAVGGSFSAGYRLAQPVSFELTYSQADSSWDESGLVDINSQIISADALLYFAESDDVSPYVLLGLSDVQFKIEDFDAKEQVSALDFGLGVKKYFSNGFTVRAEAKILHTTDNDLNHGALTVGFGYSFGDREVAVAPTAAPVAVAPAAPVEPVKPAVKVLSETVSISLNVLFDTASDVVKPQYDSEVKKVADFLAEYPTANVVIEGHTDTRGSNEYNKTLSQKRADAVAKVLVSKFGIAQSRVQAVGYGEGQPLVSNDVNAADQAKNRRVIAKLSAEKQTQVTK